MLGYKEKILKTYPRFGSRLNLRHFSCTSEPSALRLIRLMAILLGIMACASCASFAQDKQESAPKLQRLLVDGDQRRNGTFDASLEYGDDNIGWMAYSSIEIPKFVETHIAKSTNHGKTWAFVTKPNTSNEVKLEVKGKKANGVWRFETPSLLLDPTDKPDRRWKLFTNRYLVIEPFEATDRRMSDGTIEVQYSASPDKGWSKPVCVAGPSKNCRINIANADPSLNNIKFMTEPGTIVVNDVIYMSLDVGNTENGMGDWEHYRVILLASKDHGKNWRYVGTLLDHNDAMRFKYLVFTGTSLVREKGKLYLFATPSGATHKAHHDHDGTMVMELSDITQARVARDDRGTPIVVKRINITKQSGGLADYDEQNTTGGIVFPQFTLFGIPEVFQIWNTGETISGSR